MEWEVSVIEWLQRRAGGFGDALSGIFSFIGSEMGLLVIVTIAMFCWKKKAGQKLVLIIASLNVWFSMIKAIVMRPRPYVQYPDRVEAKVLVDPKAPVTDIAAQGFSFPSMHSGSVVALFFSIAQEAKKRWLFILSAVIMIFVGLSRVATGNHYPTDVLAGWALGFVVMGVIGLLYRHVQREWICHVILLAVSLPGVFFVRTEDYFTSLGLLIGAVAAISFEKKFVDYQDTRNVLAMILRVLFTFVIYFGLNTLLKLPFSKELLDSGSIGALLIRTLRYAIIMFVIMGIYPKAFPLFEAPKGRRK